MRSESPRRHWPNWSSRSCVLVRRTSINKPKMATEWRVRIEMAVIGDRPAGEIPKDHFLVQAASRALTAAGVSEASDMRISSTDANIPLSRGIPSVCLGLTEGGDAHRLSEWIEPKPLTKGVQQLLYLTWWTAAWLATGEDRVWIFDWRFWIGGLGHSLGRHSPFAICHSQGD